MKMKALIDILTQIWPYMTEEEKDKLVYALTKGNAVEAFSVFQEVKDNVVKRVGGNK